VTADTTHAVIGESASRAVAYVAMSRGRERNDVYIYTRQDGEADHEYGHLLDDGEVHQMRRGNKHTAAHSLRMILANDDRPLTMHTQAEHTQHHQLPPVVADLLERNEQRRTHRRETWRQHTADEHRRESANQRLTQTRAAEQSHQRGRSDYGYGLEL
jgi:hypothetical protein